MKRLAFFISLLSLSPAAAQTVDRDSFEVGVAAYNAGNCREALRIMKKYEKTQPAAAYVVRVCTLTTVSETDKGTSYEKNLNELAKGDLSQLDKIAMIDRFNGEIGGLSGAMRVNALKTRADGGDPTAAFQLALLYQDGRGVPQSFPAAAKYFQTAANGGNTAAMNALGVYRRFGIGGVKNEQQARELLENALLKNNAFALYNAGRLYIDAKEPLRAAIVTEAGLKRFSKTSDKKRYARMNALAGQAKKMQTPFLRAYLEKYRPYTMRFLSDGGKGVATPAELPFPPEKMIEETPFMKFIRKDAFDNRYKVFFPLMPDWAGVGGGRDNPVLNGKKPPSPAPQDPDALSALYFRPADPRHISLTLHRENSVIPVMVGDTLTLTVYTPLHETASTLKGGHLYVKNTDYTLTFVDPSGVLNPSGDYVLTPVSPETGRTESWLSRRFSIMKEGVATVRFSARKDAGENVFPYTVKIIAVKGKPPK